MPTIIKGQPTSVEIIQRLKDEGRPVLLSFSRGKDSIACWIALEDAGVEVIPVFMYGTPGLKFEDDSLAYFEKFFGIKIHRFPHLSLWKQLNVAQSPERIRIIETFGVPNLSYKSIWEQIKEDLGLSSDTWVADGVRAADSIVRRASFVKHGVMKPSSRKVSPIADWLKGEVMEAIERRGVELPIDYELFGRSFDGIDRRFIEPLKKHLPEDYQILIEWNPLIETEFLRDISEVSPPEGKTEKPQGEKFLWGRAKAEAEKRDQEKADHDTGGDMAYRQRAKAERNRMDLAVSDDYWTCYCFENEQQRIDFWDLVGAAGQRFISYKQFLPIVDKPENPKRQFDRKPLFRTKVEAPNEIERVIAADGTFANAEAFWLALANAYLVTMKAVKRPDPLKEITDSDIWVVVCYPSKEDRDKTLQDYELLKYGSRYADGSSLLKGLIAKE